MKYLLLTVFFVMSQAHAWGWGSTLEQKVVIPSYTPTSMHQVVFGNQSKWKSQPITGVLTMPKTVDKPVPVMVLSHGSGGMSLKQEQQWVDTFTELGIGSLVIDSFTPRGIKSMVANQAQLSTAANLVDALQSLIFLAADPRVDVSKIGVIGFSKGGEVAFRTALEPLRAAVIKSNLKFALHIPMYAGCNQVYWSPHVTGAPILNLLGGADDYTTAAPCVELAKKYEAAGAPTKTIVYEGAHHGFDLPAPVFWLPDATTAHVCGVVTWDIESWDIVAEQTGKHFTGNEIGSFLDSCVQRGVHAGRNDAAFKKARADVQEFVSRVLRMEDK
jgi:dienelactone hydrolase